ncbi:NeuD/PglB/VioB family sugar acetyltransferase [Altererythrobacter sp. MF3-039]|uniref:NeuD/PglB/VioB family sugar acetyltransferase n=1 Tax=Altererythrobacter sp. MF3-039 TaxID=3252901 RepID=UPI00390C480C
MLNSSVLPLCCFGAGGHGKVVASQWHRRLGGDVFFADQHIPLGTKVLNFSVAHQSIDTLDDCQLIITIGDNARRATLYRQASSRGVAHATFIADVENCYAATIGGGTMILAGGIIGCDTAIGQGVVVNNGAIVEHDCSIGDFSHLSPNSTVLGNCRIGAACWIGAGATVLPGIEIADGTIVGAGAVVTKDIPESGTYVGAPARPLASLQA